MVHTPNKNNKFLPVVNALFMALEKRDKKTGEHCERVGLLSVAVGKAAGIAKNKINILGCAAHLHDFGKIAIPDVILLKPSALNDSEYKKMKSHSSIGSEIIELADFHAAKEISNIVRHHHEHIDGTGYPDGLKGDHIPILSRIISVCDSYDAMTMRRAYRGIMTHDQALEIIHKESGTKLDSDVVNIFIKTISPGYLSE